MSFPQSLYQRDFALWIEDTVERLKAREVEQLDWENLVEEIAALGRSEKHELESHLEVLLEHLLKRCYINSPYDNHGWENTIAEQRRRLQRHLADSPSLRNYWLKVFADCWSYALQKVRKDYPNTEFPEQWFDTDIDALLSREFWNG